MNKIVSLVVAGIAAAALAAPAAGQKKETSKLAPAEKQAEQEARLKMAAAGLEKLYKVQPDARQKVEKAVGYAVFDITSLYAILF
ncbi:MAG: hypothetical protein ACRD9W_20970, partial [Terriglobia bacterium]